MVESSASVTVLDAGIDYLTATFLSPDLMPKATLRVVQVLRSEQAKGNQIKPWGMSGFTGYKCGGLQSGMRDDGLIVRLSGDTAQDHWRKFARLASNVSRIDVQTTVRNERGPSRTIQKHYREMRAKYRLFKRWPEPKLIVSPRGAQTLYSGQRSSSVFLRIYDKGEESKMDHLQGAVRYECEFKGEKATCVAESIIAEMNSARAAMSHCIRLARIRGCRLEWTSIAEPRLRRGPCQPSDDRRSLDWLEVACRRTVQRLIDSGKGAEVFSALGISGLVQ